MGPPCPDCGSAAAVGTNERHRAAGDCVVDHRGAYVCDACDLAFDREDVDPVIMRRIDRAARAAGFDQSGESRGED